MYKTSVFAFVILSIVLSVVFSPDTALQASLSGVTIWWKLVFPGLLPFFVIYEMMLSFGLVHGIQSLIGPFISRITKLPKNASLPFFMSLLGGSPIGIEPTVKLLQNKKITSKQAERLLSYSHLPNPIFVVVIIGAGFLSMPIVGFIIITTIWLTTFLLMSIHSAMISSKSSSHSHDVHEYRSEQNYRFPEAIELGRTLDGRNLGQVLGESVSSSVQKLFAVGGFIIFFSVISTFASKALHFLFPQLPFLSSVLLEQHIGSYAITTWIMDHNSLIFGAACIATCLSFSGLSGILQLSYFINGSNIRLLPIIYYRIIHAIVSFFMIYILWKPLGFIFSKWLPADQSVFYDPLQYITPSTYQVSQLPNIWLESVMLTACLLFIVTISTLLINKVKQ